METISVYAVWRNNDSEWELVGLFTGMSEARDALIQDTKSWGFPAQWKVTIEYVN